MNKFIGKWKITEIEQWYLDYIDLVEHGYFLFDDVGMGDYVFGTVSGFINCRFIDDKGIPGVEFSWEGISEMDSECGRDWFELKEKNQIYGRLFIHNSDDSWIKAEKK